MSSIIQVANLSKSINKHTIIDNISFSVSKGDILGFLGPNGAGKSTTIKMMLGLVKPTKGSIELCGYNIVKNRTEALSKVGAMVETPAFYEYMSGYQNLMLYANLYGIGKSRVEEVLALVHLSSDKNKKVRKYSLGMKQRLGIARAFLNAPNVIILDEPTNGLDPVGIIEIRQIITHLAESQNITFIICSHILGEIQVMCNKLVIINKGKLIAYGLTDKLMEEANCASLEEYYIAALRSDEID